MAIKKYYMCMNTSEHEQSVYTNNHFFLSQSPEPKDQLIKCKISTIYMHQEMNLTITPSPPVGNVSAISYFNAKGLEI